MACDASLVIDHLFASLSHPDGISTPEAPATSPAPTIDTGEVTAHGSSAYSRREKRLPAAAAEALEQRREHENLHQYHDQAALSEHPADHARTQVQHLLALQCQTDLEATNIEHHEQRQRQ